MISIEEIINICKTESIESISKILEKEINDPSSELNVLAFINYLPSNVWRARKHNHPKGILTNFNKIEEFYTEKEFWNPPAKFIKNMGRCNDVNESIFYCANEASTSVIECRPQIGDYFTLGTFHRKKNYIEKQENFMIHMIGAKYLSHIPFFRTLDKEVSAIRNPKSMIIDDFLDDIFHKELNNKSEEYLYKLSIAITKIKFMPVAASKKSSETVIPKGLYYSSIMRNKKDFNLVLNPEFAKKKYYLKGVTTIQILQIEDNRIIYKKVRDGWPMVINNKLDIIWTPIFKDNILHDFKF